jgi:iron complex transport system substrate-binding protein
VSRRRWVAQLAFCALTLQLTLTQAAIQVTDDRGQRIDLPAPAQRVVSLLPSLTETVCALQACTRLVGTDRYSNWPSSVLALPKLGGLDDTQIERIVALKPDLVLAAVSSRAIGRLEALGLRVLALEPQNLADTRRVMGVVAQALGQGAAAENLWLNIEQRVAAAALRVPPSLRGQTVYVEVSSEPYAAGEASYAGELLKRLGLVNVVPAALGSFPKLNPEFVVRAQPYIVMASARALADMPGRPGWAALQALRDKRSCGFATQPWDTLVRPGPRLPDAAEALADCLAGLAASGPASGPVVGLNRP